MMGQKLLFARPGGGHVLIPSAVVDVLWSHRQMRWCSPEAGGIMLGRIMDQGNDIIVDAVTKPTALDGAGRFFFRRARRPAQQAILDAWRTTDGTRNYLGEWHTHPEPTPTPSGPDRSDWRRLYEQATFEQDSLFFLIVGQLDIVVWELGAAHGLKEACLVRPHPPP